MEAGLVFGNQLFDVERWGGSLPSLVYLAEDRELCTHFRYHKHKLILFLSAMRHYRDELDRAGHRVHYEPLNETTRGLNYEEKLRRFLEKNQIRTLVTWEIEDKFMETRIRQLCASLNVELRELPSPMFVTSREEFRKYLGKGRKPFLKTFYESQRRRLKILLTKEGGPVGGQWSFDAENRKRLPKKLVPPEPVFPEADSLTEQVRCLVDAEFGDHPGASSNFWCPVDRRQSLVWLQEFLNRRFPQFGEYEDALSEESDFVFHSVLTPMLNLGLLTPDEVVDATLKAAKKAKVPLNSLEGFIRQVIGWREFVRGIYQNYSEKEDTANFWGHHRLLTEVWYTGETGLLPLDLAIKKVQKWGYTHHIERLMVLGNLMLLCEVAPPEAHRWFMEMYVDSSDWVMGPNVYGMALHSDGGLFTTKPYLCGSNYLLKMGNYSKGAWCDVMDGLFWRFIHRHRPFFEKNPRLSMMARSLDKMDPERFRRLNACAEEFIARVTRSP